MKFQPGFFLFLVSIILIFSCRKERFTNDPSARIIATTDTVKFDTVFTSTGSVSHFFKLINDNNRALRISQVKLAGGSSSPFKINVDGTPGPSVSNVEIGDGDSIYIYVTVSINPNASNIPFVVEDSIEIAYNGNLKKVQLQAYGKNAHFFRNKIISGNETWENDLPYVILERLTILPNATLTINKGCRIFVHADAPLIIDGTLRVLGEAAEADRVVFAGDRLDEPYRDYPAGYPGLIFTETSTNNLLRYTTVKNAYQAIVAIEQGAGTKLKLEQVIIDNAYDAGILAIHSNIVADNLQISNCGKNLVILKGGNYAFNHLTSAAWSTSFFQHKDPVLFISNFLSQNNVPVVAPLQAVFRNSIFWGESGGIVTNEVVTARQPAAAFDLLFDNVLWRVQSDPQNSQITGNNIKNQHPQFDSINVSQRIFDLRLKETSPALNKGSLTGLNIDMDGLPRPVNLPDLGAYERQ